MSLTITILGCGSSGGVPRVGSGWGDADPANAKNRRRRCSILVERGEPGARTSVLVDVSPDLREQLLDADVRRLDAVLVTHDHADHLHGIDDLRPLVIHMRRRLSLHADAETTRVLFERFAYCFETPPGSDYPPILDHHSIAPPAPVVVDGAGGPISAEPFVMEHGRTRALGFRFDDVAYASDVSALPPESLARLEGLDLLIIDALRYRRHPTHFSVEEALDLVAKLRPRRAVLTNLHTDLDYETLRREVPEGVQPAFDGMQLRSPG